MVELVEDGVVSIEVTDVVVTSVKVLDEAGSTELIVEVVMSRGVVDTVVVSSKIEEDAVLVGVASTESVADVGTSRGVVDAVVVSSKVEGNSLLVVVASTELVTIVGRSRDATGAVVLLAIGGPDVDDELIDEISMSREVVNAVAVWIDVLKEDGSMDVSSNAALVLAGTLIVEIGELEGCSLDVVGSTSSIMLKADASVVLFC